MPEPRIPETTLMARAAGPLLEIIRNIKPDQLDAPTPCTEYNVRQLINHLLFWGPSLEAAARKQAVPPPGDADTDVDPTGGDWAAALQAQVERTVAAWSEPTAWQGTTQMGSPMDIPAPLVGGMVVGELVVHGWDLARATGQHPTWDEDVIVYLLGETAKSAEQGRQMGIYGPQVLVTAGSPPLDRMLGLTGRDPAWPQ